MHMVLSSSACAQSLTFEHLRNDFGNLDEDDLAQLRESFISHDFANSLELLDDTCRSLIDIVELLWP